MWHYTIDTLKIVFIQECWRNKKHYSWWKGRDSGRGVQEYYFVPKKHYLFNNFDDFVFGSFCCWNFLFSNIQIQLSVLYLIIKSSRTKPRALEHSVTIFQNIIKVAQPLHSRLRTPNNIQFKKTKLFFASLCLWNIETNGFEVFTAKEKRDFPINKWNVIS